MNLAWWNAPTVVINTTEINEQHANINVKMISMSWFEEHVKYDKHRVIILLTFLLKVIETLHDITKSG